MPGITISEEKHQIYPVTLDFAQCGFGAIDPADRVAELFKQIGADGGDIRIVFDQQHGAAAAGVDGIGAVNGQARILSRQQDRDRGLLAKLAAHLDRSAGLMGETIDLREARSGALADRFGGEEGIEFLLSTSSAMPVPVSETEIATYSPALRFVAERAVIGGNRDCSAVRHRIPRVDDEIDQRGLGSATSTMTANDCRPISNCSRTVPPTPVLRTSRTALILSVTSTACGLTLCRRANVSNWLVRAAPRRVAPSIAASARSAALDRRRRPS